MESDILSLHFSSFAYKRDFFDMHPTGGADKTIKSRGVLCCPKGQIHIPKRNCPQTNSIKFSALGMSLEEGG